MNIHILTIVKCFIGGVIFFLTAYLITISNRHFPSKEKSVMCSFWVMAGITFWINAILIALFILGKTDASFFALKVMVVFMMIQLWIGIHLLFYKLIQNKSLFNLISGIVGIFLVSQTILYLTRPRYEIVFGEPRIVFPGGPSVSYLISAFLLMLLIFGFWIIYREFQSGSSFWLNLASVYRFSSLGIYGMVAFLRIFYFLPHPWYLEIFYPLILVLNYLALKEEKIL
ncbi:MAG: hypothetical protein LR000_02335 [Candidatus Pacebacteria bacterium]|nr:hypothetical protein [Candidatus Paceibacterota bacterium]